MSTELIALRGLAAAQQQLIKQLIEDKQSLLNAAQTVMDGLLLRIDEAPGNAKPVFHGIADLYDEINKARGKSQP